MATYIYICLKKNRMKNLLFSFLCMFIAFTAYSQNNLDEVVYLKNGSIIRGTIIEQIPNESLKIQTKDGNVFVYKMSEIEKTTKEAPIKNLENYNQSSNSNSYLNQNMSHYKSAGIGCTVTGLIFVIAGGSCFAIPDSRYSGRRSVAGVISGITLLCASFPMLVAGPIMLGKYGRAKRELQNQKGFAFAPTIKSHNLDGISTNASSSILSYGISLKFNF